jgi:glyoxylase-like metal-dependent hydrolase (beta-lactamase superfamily II)
MLLVHAFSTPPCAKCRRACGTGRRRTRTGPRALPSEIEKLAAGCETAIVLTCPWQQRDAVGLAEWFGAPIYVPPPDPRDPNPVPGHVFIAGDRLPVGVEAFPGMEPNDLMLWFESRRALVAGDTLLDRGQGLEIPWPPPEQVGAAAQGQILEALLPVLELPVELVLPAHGAPSDRTVLERALS